jgi:CHAT domain-containing protein/tetratricopeptide (TPR) repeat protein
MNFTCLAAACLLFTGQPGTDPWYKERAARAEKHAQNGNEKEAMDLIKEMESQAKLDSTKWRELWEQHAQWKKGVCYFWLGDYGQSIATLRGIKAKETNHPFFHYVCRELGEAYLDSGRVKEAEPYFPQALKLGAEYEKETKIRQYKESEQLRIQLLQVRCKLNLGKIDNAREKLAALEDGVFETTKKIDEATNDQRAELQAEWQILRAETDLHDRNLVSALGRLETSQEKLESFPDNRKAVFLRFRCHLGLARDYWLLARFDNADAHLKRAETLVASGKLYRTDFGYADIKNARAGLTIEKTYLDVEDDVPATKILTNLDQAEKNLNEAILHHDKVHRDKDMFTASVDFHRAQLHELRGRALAASGQKADSARQQFQAGKQRCDDALKQLQGLLQLADNHDRTLEVRNRRAWLNFRLGDAKAARDEASEALKLFESQHGKENIDRGRYLHMLVEAESALGHTAQAHQYAAEHRRLLDTGLGTMLAALSASEQVQFFRRWDTPGLHASLRLGMKHGNDNQKLAASSVEWLINGKAKLTEVLAAHTQATRAASKQSFVSYQDSVTRQAYYLYGRSNSDDKILQQLYLGEEAKKRGLATLAAKNRLAPRWYTLSEVQENLPEDEVYVGIYALRPDDSKTRAYHAWVVPRQGPIQTLKLGEAREIEGLVKVFLTEIEKVPSIAPGDEKQAEERLKQKCLAKLSSLVLHPIQKLAGGKKKWIISPDGSLWNIPWAALLLPGPDQRYAIEELTCRYAVSGQDLVQPREPPAKGEPLVLGDPFFNHPDTDRQRLRTPGLDPLWLPWDRLEYSRRECETVLAIMEEFNLKPTRMLGVVQKKQLVGLRLPPRMVYFSTHAFATLRGSVDVNDPLLSCALAFAGWNYLPKSGESGLPGMMTGAEVLGIDLRGTELVVLASCAAGTEELSYGQSPANLRHAFHLAGARAVVSALWGINDKSTQELMEPFMESICAQNMGKVAALHEAQQQSIRYLRMYRDHTHPFYWAAFTISGS